MLSRFSSVQSLSRGPTLCNPMDRSTPALPVHHQLPELTQTHVHGVGDAIQLSHPVPSPSPPAFHLSQHQGLFKWVSSSQQVLQVCPALCSTMGRSLTDSSVHGILQARILEWVAMPSSRGSSQPRDQTLVSCIAGWFFTAEPRRNPYGLLEDIEYYMCSDVKNFETGFVSNWWRSRIGFPFVLPQNGVQFSSVSRSCLTLCDPMDWSTPAFPVHHQLLEFTQTHVHWHAIQSSHPVFPFSSWLQSFPALGSFQMSQFFASAGQRVGVSASASVLPMNIQDWFPLVWIGWISLLSKGLSRVFSNTTVQMHQFFSAQLSL